MRARRRCRCRPRGRVDPHAWRAPPARARVPVREMSRDWHYDDVGRTGVAGRGGAVDGAPACGTSVTPPDTMNAITAELSAVSRRICARGKTTRLPAKLYDCGKYTA